MNKYTGLSILCFIAGVFLLILGGSQGQGKVYWIIFFPVFEGTGIFSIVGILLVMLGIFFFMFSLAAGSFELVGFGGLGGLGGLEGFEDFDPDHNHDHDRPLRKHRTPASAQHRPVQKPKTSIKSGGVIFIGPIPIIWGSDKKTGYIMAIVALVLAITFVLVFIAWIL